MENFWSGKNVFITGANGFLGSHITSLLIERGVRPTVLIYEENPGGIFEQQNLAARARVVRGDIRDFALLNDTIRNYAIDSVFHLAAHSIADQALEDPLAALEVNVKGTWNILEAGRRNPGVQRIVVASSEKAYGQHETVPYSESTHYLCAEYPYEVSKACVDLISRSFHRAFGLPVCVTRCSNVYGPGDLKMSRIVPQTISRLHAGEAPVIRGTVESLRDYVYVGDVAEAYIMLAEKIGEGLRGEAFNFSTNTPLSALNVIAAISAQMAKHISPTVSAVEGMDAHHQYSSYEKAKQCLGWEPRHTFEEGLQKTIPWYVHHLGAAEKRV